MASLSAFKWCLQLHPRWHTLSTTHNLEASRDDVDFDTRAGLAASGRSGIASQEPTACTGTTGSQGAAAPAEGEHEPFNVDDPVLEEGGVELGNVEDFELDNADVPALVDEVDAMLPLVALVLEEVGDEMEDVEGEDVLLDGAVDDVGAFDKV